jgi:hypothetical protein
LLPYSSGTTTLSPAAAGAHFTNAYDFAAASQFNQAAQLDATTLNAAAAAAAAGFPYNTSPLSSANPAAVASSQNLAYNAYAALAQQALPTLTAAAAYQQ